MMRGPAWLMALLVIAVAASPAAAQSYFSHQNLVGKLLVASPEIPDGIFTETVILVVAHGPGGALGLVINRPLEIAAAEKRPSFRATRGASIRTVFGGPVEPDRQFVLHTSDYMIEGTVRVGSGFAVTGNPDVLDAIASGRGPRHSLRALGYAGWETGQVEEELMRHSWIVIDADEDLVFSRDAGGIWGRALARQGESL